ncbi:hypothetical protein MWU52_16790 [Jannaschia sp. S6380]|uniref:hypothetical protein n=1 Tax=Jannaschia sp. S6380 TaxID=2926408 RepID=UPI001FF340E8|nr:hypothetical protein [Jannaschia sp. S6380]MCK0169213.1 hypothetical protein [Jannaschia sp. S6380]
MSRPDLKALIVGPEFRSAAGRARIAADLARDGIRLAYATSQDEAALWLCDNDPSIVLIDLELADGSPLAVADFCNYRRPEARVLLQGGGHLFTDGSIFGLVGNAHALVPAQMSEADIASLMAFHSHAAKAPMDRWQAVAPA